MLIKDNEMLRHEAIRNLYNNVTLINELGNFDADEAEVTIDQSLVDAEVTRLQGLQDGLAYARARKAKYDLLNQDEMRFDDQANSTTTWVDAINAIKAAHPKP